MSRATSSGPESWRRRSPAGDDDAPASRTIRRWVSTVFCLALAILLGFVVHELWQEPRTFVAILPMDANQAMGNANPKWNSAVAVLKNNLESANRAFKVADWNDSDTSSSKALEESVANKISQWSPDKSDTVIVYVSANSVCVDGEPYVLYQDFQLDDLASKKPATAVLVTDLFDQLRKCKAACKLLVIDTGRIAYDPRLGVLVNEFPRAVEQKIKEWDDQDLYVLLPCSTLESTAGIESFTPSPFANIFTRSLLGDADREPYYRQLTLAELYSFVWNCSAASFGDDAAFRQTPVLLQGGQGVVERNDPLAKKIVVDQLPAPQIPDEDASDTSPGSDDKKKKKNTEPVSQHRWWRGVSAAGLAWIQAPSNQQKTEAASNESEANQTDTKTNGSLEDHDKDKTTTAISGDVPTKTNSKAGSTAISQPVENMVAEELAKKPGEAADLAADRGRVELDRMWKTRDALVSVNRDFWGPIDVAPHVWRVVERELRKLEARVLTSGDTVDAIRETDDVSIELDKLLQYLRNTEDGSPPRLRSLRIGQELEKIVASASRLQRLVAGEFAAQTSVDLLFRVQLEYNHALYAIVSHRNWLTRARAPRAGGDSTFGQSRALTETHLGKVLELRDMLQQLENGKSGSKPGSTPIILLDEKVLKELRLELREAADKIDLQVQSDVSLAFERAGLAGEKQRRLLLGTCLLTSTQRQRLNAKRTDGGVFRIPDQFPTPRSPDLNDLSEYHDLLDARILVEIQVIETFDPEAAKALRRVFKDVTDHWLRYRQLGSMMAKWYRDIPDRLRDVRGIEGSSVRRQTRELLVMLDPRDVERLPPGIELGNDFRLKPRKPNPRLAFVNNLPSVVTSMRKPTSYELAFQLKEVTGPVHFSASFDAETLKMSYGGKQVMPETWTVLSSKDFKARQVSLSILALDDREEGSRVDNSPLSFRLRANGAADTNPIVVHYKLPLPNLIDLLVVREGSTNKLGSGQDVLQLESIPSPAGEEPFASEFKFYLQNHSGEERTIRAQLILVPKIRERTWAPGKFGQNGQADPMTRRAVFIDGDPKLGLREEILAKNVLADVEVPLPAGTIERPLLFAIKKDEAIAAADGVAETKPDDEKTETVDVTHGLLCLLTDVADREQVWPKWLELRTLHPRKYLEAEAKYEDGAIHAKVSRLDDIDGDGKYDEISRWTREAPGTIQWGDNIPKLSARKSITLKQGIIEAPGVREQVELSIDGYPRAFVIEVERRSNGEIENYKRGAFEQARLMSATAVFPGTVANPARPDQTKRFDPKLNQRLVFKPCKQLRVAFAIDVQTNRFVGEYAAEKGIQLLVNDEPQGNPVYADRVIETRLVSCNGNVVLFTFVTDYELPVPATVLDETLTITIKPGFSSTVGQIYLDSIPPTIDRNASDEVESVFEGESLRPTIKFEDDGGLGEVRIGIDKAAPFRILDDADSPQPPIDLSKFGKRATKIFELATDKLKFRTDAYHYIVQTTDLAGNQGAPILFEFHIKKPPPEAMKTFVIRGFVVDYKEKPIKGSNWTLTVSGPDTEETLMHGKSSRFADSKFEFSKLSKGKYTVRVVGPGNFGDVGDQAIISASAAKDAKVQSLQATRANYKKMTAPAN